MKAWETLMVLRRLAVAFALWGGACADGAGPAAAPRPSAPMAEPLRLEAVQRGRRLVADACAGCHAVAGTGPSPMADATPFREIVTRYPLRNLEEAFAEGLVTSHPAMPDFVFRAGEIDDLIAYLEDVKAQKP